MTRTLRVLALAGLLAFGVFAALAYAFYVQAIPPFTSVAAQLLRNFFGTTSFALAFALAFAAGVIGAVACIQRRQWGWAAALLGLLVSAVYGFYLAFPLLLLMVRSNWFLVGSSPIVALQDLSVTQYAPAMALALLVLGYSYRRPPAISAAPGQG